MSITEGGTCPDCETGTLEHKEWVQSKIYAPTFNGDITVDGTKEQILKCSRCGHEF